MHRFQEKELKDKIKRSLVFAMEGKKSVINFEHLRKLYKTESESCLAEVIAGALEEIGFKGEIKVGI